MSKKDRLRREKEKQLKQQKELEKEEILLKSANIESKASKKYKKTSTKVKEPVYFLVMKFAQLLVFGYSGFYWGGVLILAIVFDLINRYSFSTVSNITAVFIACGVVVMCASLVLGFLKKYTTAFVVSIVGLVAYLYGVNQFIIPIKNEIGDKAVVNSNLLTLDEQWMRRCYPIIVFTVISFIMFIIKVIQGVIKKKKEKEKMDNAPVKSIVSD
ncbi:MAG: hypothetical protein GX896_04775 [Clostridiales bacterium]|nr:hypothetical protein [Clostridiales bacterium]